MTPQQIRATIEHEKLQLRIYAQIAGLRRLAEQSSTEFSQAQASLSNALALLIDQPGAEYYPPRKAK
jgi:hypothetical protein